MLTTIRKVCKFVHFTGGEKVSNFAHFNQESVQICSLWWWGSTEKVSNFAHFNQESVQICSLYWWGGGEQLCSLQSGKCANLFTLLMGRISIRKVCKFVHFTGGEKVSNFAHFNQESVQICSLYWWGEGEQFCSLQSGKCANLFTLLMGRTSIRKVYKFVDFTGGEKLSNFAHFNQESVQICSLYWWGEGEQFCSLQSGKCANLFTLLVGRR